MSLPDYSIQTAFCRREHIHGGCAIYTKNNIISKPLELLKSFASEMHMECCGVELHCGQHKIVVVVIYRPPSGDYERFLSLATHLIGQALRIAPNLVLCGDLNVDYLKQSDRKTKYLKDLLESFDLQNLCRGPTRIASTATGTTETSIDYMVTNINSLPHTCEIKQPHLSDHLLQELKIFLEPHRSEDKTPKPIKVRLLGERNLNELKIKLRHEDWESLKRKNVNDAMEAFLQTFMWHYEMACPKKVVKPQIKQNNWFDAQLRTDRDNLRDLYSLAARTGNEHLLQLYRERRRMYRKSIRDAKVNHNARRIHNSDNTSKQVWNIISEEMGTKRKTSHIHLKVVGDTITDQKRIAEEFAGYFSTIAENKIKDHFGDNIRLAPTLSDVEQPNTVFLEPVSTTEIENIIKNLKNKKSVGTDDVAVKALKAVANEISEPLQILIEASMETGTFPTSLKTAKVIPIFKKGDRESIENYRPVSVLSAFSKVFERVLYNRISNFLKKYKLLNENQHGFRSGRSTETASVELVDFIQRELDAGRSVVGIFFDLSRAFDTLNLDFVKMKLSNLGIRGNALSIVMSFLRERRLLVNVNGYESDLHDVNIGAAQGSILAPLIFLLFVNDLSLPGITIKFADDTSVGIAADNEEALIEQIHQVCDSMKQWCTSNRLILNQYKTVTINFYKNIQSKSGILNSSNQTKFLGTFLDEKTSWEPQIDHICAGLAKSYYALLKLKNSVPTDTMLHIYYGMAYHYLSYNILLWGQATNVNRVLVAQKRIIRLIFGLKPLESCRGVFKQNQILTVTSIYICKCAIYVYRNQTKFRKNGESHQYPTRNAAALNIPKHRTSHYETSPHYACIKIYNNLPETVKHANSFNIFRSRLRKHLVQRTLYGLSEYYQ